MDRGFKHILLSSVLAVLLSLMTISTFFTADCYAADTVIKVKMSPYISGLSNGNLVPDKKIIFCPEEIIWSDERMTEAFYETEKLQELKLDIYCISSDKEGVRKENSISWGNSLDTPGNNKNCTIPPKKEGGKTRQYAVLRIKINNITFTSENIYYPCEDIGKATVGEIKSITYTGKAIEPKPTITYNGVSLTRNVDYTLSYKNNVNAGTATLTVEGINRYKGTIRKTFTIAKAANPIKVTGRTAKVQYSKLKSSSQKLKRSAVMTITGSKGTLSFAKKSGNSKITINKTSGQVTVGKGLKKGSYNVKVTVTAAGNSNYKSGSNTITFTIKVV